MPDSIASEAQTRVPTPDGEHEQPLSSKDAKVELSELQSTLHREATRKSTDLEKGKSSDAEAYQVDDDEFNLLEYLKSDKDARSLVLEEVKRERAKKKGDLEMGGVADLE
ncbi:hypothetical protein BT69DRAFT_1350316, partial [Atractiella rhizophila]